MAATWTVIGGLVLEVEDTATLKGAGSGTTGIIREQSEYAGGNVNEIQLNPGAQHDFVLNDSLHSAYMGGRGAGKTFALVVRGLLYANQPKIPGEAPPVGCLLTDSFPHLKDIVYPVMYKVLDLAGYKIGSGKNTVREVKNQSDRKFILPNGAEILMRSLDDPNRIRGLTLAWFGVDEGRMFDSAYAYNTLADCLRQGTHPDEEVDELGIWIPGENYKQAGFVTSTPNGYDWQYRLFHPESRKRLDGAKLYMASLFENQKHLPRNFIRSITSRHEGLMYQQEVEGKFVGAVGGAVWPMFDPQKHVGQVPYDYSMPLYAGWDFGIGDNGVCLFVQIEWDEKKIYDGSIVQVPQLRVVGMIEMNDATVKDWANAFYQYCDRHFAGRLPDRMWGDPAGAQRGPTGVSWIRGLHDHGVYVVPAPKRPLDEGVIIIQNLMERDEGFIIDEDQERVEQAVKTYRFRVDDEGVRLSKEPIHDWTSHICSALRYLAIGAIGLGHRRTPTLTEEARRGTMGYVMEQLMAQESDEVLMNQEDDARSRIDWHLDEEVGLSGLLD